MDIKGLIKKYIRFVKFNMVGILNTIITFVISVSLYKGLGLIYFWAETIGYSAGLINSFVLNRIWTFGQKHRFHFAEALKFMIVSVIAWGGTIIILGIFGKDGLFLPQWLAEMLHTEARVFSGLGLDYIIAKGIAYLFSVPVNYFGFKLWVFPQKSENQQSGNSEAKETE